MPDWTMNACYDPALKDRMYFSFEGVDFDMNRVFGDPDEVDRDTIFENTIEWLSHGGEYP